jgi:hypothetical protein
MDVDARLRERLQTFSIMVLIIALWTLGMKEIEHEKRISALEHDTCWKAVP